MPVSRKREWQLRQESNFYYKIVKSGNLNSRFFCTILINLYQMRVIIVNFSQQHCEKNVPFQIQFFKLNPETMKKSLISLLAFILLLFVASCSRGITINEAANGKAKCGRYIK